MSNGADKSNLFSKCKKYQGNVSSDGTVVLDRFTCLPQEEHLWVTCGEVFVSLVSSVNEVFTVSDFQVLWNLLICGTVGGRTAVYVS